jgi:hypothetical protein
MSTGCQVIDITPRLYWFNMLNSALASTLTPEAVYGFKFKLERRRDTTQPLRIHTDPGSQSSNTLHPKLLLCIMFETWKKQD